MAEEDVPPLKMRKKSVGHRLHVIDPLLKSDQ